MNTILALLSSMFPGVGALTAEDAIATGVPATTLAFIREGLTLHQLV